jgi:protein-disulfide isomerase
MRCAMNNAKRKFRNIGAGLFVSLAICFAFIVPLASAQVQAPSSQKPLDEEALIQRLKTEILRALQEGDWMSEQVGRGIEKYGQKIKAAQDAALAEQARRADEKAKSIRPINRATDHIRGNPDAEVSLIEYSDFECPFCKRFHPTAMEVLKSSDGRVNWVFRHFPLEMHNPAAEKHAEAAECAGQQGGSQAFWAYADAVFARTTPTAQQFEKKILLTVARELRLDEQRFSRCLAGGAQLGRVKEDLAEGERIGVTGTPTTVLLNNRTGDARVIVGISSVDELKTKIAQLMAPK